MYHHCHEEQEPEGAAESEGGRSEAASASSSAASISCVMCSVEALHYAFFPAPS
jgi:hypothetical protein